MNPKRTIAAVAVASALVAAACGSSTASTSTTAAAKDSAAATSGPGTTASAPASTAKPATTTTAAPTTTTSSKGTRTAPYAIGDKFTVPDKDNGNVDVTVTGFTGDASAEIAAANQLNKPAPDGSKYTLVTLSITYHAGAKKQSANAFGLVSLSAFGPAAVEIKANCAPSYPVIPDKLESTTELLDGGTLAGNVCFGVTAADAVGPLLLRISESLCATNCDQAWIRLQ